MPLIGELTVTCLPDVSSGEVFAMDFPVDDGVSCLATNTMKIKKKICMEEQSKMLATEIEKFSAEQYALQVSTNSL